MVSSDIVKLLFGDAYVLPFNIPFVIALNFYMVGIQNAVWSFQNAMGLFRQGRYLLLLTAAINLICSIWLGNIWGLFGILIATSISRLLTNTWFDPYKVFKYGFKESVMPYYLRRLMYFVIMVISALICFLFGNFIHGELWVIILYKILICSIIPNVILLILFHKTSEFHYYVELMNNVKDYFKRRR